MLRQTFKVELVTPCFLGGAKGQADWRGASIRGQLRWWFRAVAGAYFAADLDQVRHQVLSASLTDSPPLSDSGGESTTRSPSRTPVST